MQCSQIIKPLPLECALAAATGLRCRALKRGRDIGTNPAIDDEENILRLLKIMLTDAGHEVVTAMDGQAGLKCMAANKFDLVITDIVMPVTEGIETIQYLRRITATLPILAISGGGRFGNLGHASGGKETWRDGDVTEALLEG